MREGASSAGVAQWLLKGQHLLRLAVAGMKVLEDGGHQALLSPLLLVHHLLLGQRRGGVRLLEGGRRSFHVVVGGTDGADLVNGKDLLEVVSHGLHGVFRAVLRSAG